MGGLVVQESVLPQEYRGAVREVSEDIMDLSTIAESLSTATAASGVVSTVDLSVLKSVQDLQAALTAEMFGSLGLGTTVDAFA
jgi:hypothetical protein